MCLHLCVPHKWLGGQFVCNHGWICIGCHRSCCLEPVALREVAQRSEQPHECTAEGPLRVAHELGFRLVTRGEGGLTTKRMLGRCRPHDLGKSGPPWAQFAFDASGHQERVVRSNGIGVPVGVVVLDILLVVLVASASLQVFALQIVRYSDGVHPWALPMYCLGFGALVLQGSAVFVSAKLDCVEGDTLKAKLDVVNAMSVERLTSALSDKDTRHHCFEVSEGDAFVTPAGCMLAGKTDDFVIVRWSRLTKSPEEFRKVLMAMTLAQQAYPPSVVGHFADLMKYIQSA